MLTMTVEQRTRPSDFDETFVEIGRLACEERYRVGRNTVTRWLEEAGFARLTAQRTEFVRTKADLRNVRPCPPDFDLAFVQLGAKGCEKRYGAHNRTVQRWLSERGREKLTSQRAASQAGDALERFKQGAVLRRAAHFLREVRHGGHIVSICGECWRVGHRVVSADELLAMAKAKGFEPNITPGAPSEG